MIDIDFFNELIFGVLSGFFNLVFSNLWGIVFLFFSFYFIGFLIGILQRK